MNEVGGSVVWTIKADTGKFTSRLKKAKAEAKATGNNMAATSKKVGLAIGTNLGRGLETFSRNFNRVAINVGKRLASLGVKAAKFGVILGGVTLGKGLQLAADLEQTRVAFNNFFGDVDQAGRVLTDLREFSSVTPFEFADVADSGRKLLSIAGIAEDELIPTLTSLGDIAASQGKGLDQVAEAFNDAIVGEFERLKEFGIRASVAGDRVTFTFKGQATEVAKTTEGIGTYITELGLAEGVTGAMDQQSRTLSGRISTLKDRFGGLLTSIVGVTQAGDVLEGGIFDRLSRAVENFAIRLSEIDTVKLSNDISNFIDRAKELIKFLIDNRGTIKNFILGFGGFVLVTKSLKALNTTINIVVATAQKAGKLISLSGKLAVLGWRATKVSATWVIEMAKVIVTFTRVAAAAALSSARTTASWVASSAASSKAFLAFRSLATTPIIMPALAIAAALASIATVVKAIQAAVDLSKLLDQNLESEKKRGDFIGDFFVSLRRARDEGRITEEEFQRRSRAAGNSFQANAKGTNFSPGGITLVGEEGPELVELPRGARVNTARETRDIFSQAREQINTPISPPVLKSSNNNDTQSTPSVSINLNMSGVMTRSRFEQRQVAKDMIESVNEELRSRGVDEIGGGNLRGVVA